MVQAKCNPRYDYLMSIVETMPSSPGVYRYLDAHGTIIYVGKAKNLKRRVSSYFTKDHESRRTVNLVRNIFDLKYIVVNTENDALNLENRMIKAHQPRYNVLLKDGKTYPWICVRNEAFPRVFLTRHVVKDGSSYFGPYTNVRIAKALLEMFESVYHIRTCSLNLQSLIAAKSHYKPCLKYHIGKCKAPCVDGVSRETYQAGIDEIKQILRGHTAELCRALYDMMMDRAGQLKFEEAEQIKQRYELIEGYRVKSNIVPSVISDVDVFAYDEEGSSAIVSYFHIVHGAIIRSYTIEYRKQIEEPKEDVLALGILELRERFEAEETPDNDDDLLVDDEKLVSKRGAKDSLVELIVPFEPSVVPDGCRVFIPQRGDKRMLLELAEKNCRQYRIDQTKRSDKLNPEQRQTRLLSEIQKQLGLSKLPLHIESFDNSNVSGTCPVASCVVFRNGKPSKQEYRKFNIQSVAGPDDYASMHEVVMRRYRRLIDEMGEMPDLILADGGVGQMGVIKQGLLDLEGQYLQQQIEGQISAERMDEIHSLLQIPVGGLVKDGRHRTRQLLFGDPPQAIDIKAGSNLFHLMEHIQDEVHRFAITFHRQKRSKNMVHSELDSIKGIGPKTKQTLLQAFKSVTRLREADITEISALVGPAKAKTIKDFFSNNSPLSC